MVDDLPPITELPGAPLPPFGFDTVPSAWQRAMRWDAAVARAQEAYSARQPRDAKGRWTSHGVGELGPAAAELVSKTRSQGGATLSPGTLQPVEHGVAVATPGHGAVLDAERYLNDDEYAIGQTKAWLKSQRATLAADPNSNLGAWLDRDSGKVVYDVVTVVDRTTAIKLGQERNERAVYDLDAQEEIPTGGTGGYT